MVDGVQRGHDNILGENVCLANFFILFCWTIKMSFRIFKIIQEMSIFSFFSISML